MQNVLTAALQARATLLEKLHAEGTNCYRLFHGVVEGKPGLTIDRYNSLVLVQTFREPLSSGELEELEKLLREKLSFAFVFAYNHRGKTAVQSFEQWHQPQTDALVDIHAQEFGLNYLIKARHQGIDPWLFLDMRAGRRFVRQHAKGLSVLNLFSYTCSVGLTAAAAGANEVWNVDFAASNLEVGRKNAQLNNVPENRLRYIEDDCLPIMRQLAGLPAGGRYTQAKKFQKLDPREFDLVFLDPPAWSKGPFGAVDVVGDYQSLFKAAVLATKSGGGRVIATNHVASADIKSFIDVLTRCATKAGRPLLSTEVITPESDFPSYDGNPPLKIVVCEV